MFASKLSALRIASFPLPFLPTPTPQGDVMKAAQNSYCRAPACAPDTCESPASQRRRVAICGVSKFFRNFEGFLISSARAF